MLCRAHVAVERLHKINVGDLEAAILWHAIRYEQMNRVLSAEMAMAVWYHLEKCTISLSITQFSFILHSHPCK